MSSTHPLAGSGRIRSFVALLALAAAACAGEALPPAAQVVQGECGDVFGGQVCTWGEQVGDAVVAFGATVPVAMVEAAPPDAPMLWPPVANATLMLPEAVRNATGFQLLTVYWEAHGHPPGPYLTPHFDFHFYGISPEQLAAIDCADVSKPAELPAGYQLPDVAVPELGNLVGLCVPAMGMHALPGAELEATEPFSKTMVIGYISGSPIFVEPMIASATLLARQDFTVDMPALPGAPASWRVPTTFQATWDAESQSYRFVFSGIGTSPTGPVASR